MTRTSVAQLASQRPDPEPVLLRQASLVLGDTTYDATATSWRSPGGKGTRSLSIEVTRTRPLSSTSDTEPGAYPPSGGDGGPSLSVPSTTEPGAYPPSGGDGGPSLSVPSTTEPGAYPPSGGDGGPSLRLSSHGCAIALEIKTASPPRGATARATLVRRQWSASAVVPTGEPLELEVTPPGADDGGPSLKVSFVAE